MARPDRKLLQTALAIREKLESQTLSTTVQLDDSLWNSCRKLHRQLRRAKHHGWTLAAQRLQRDLASRLREFDNELRNVISSLQPTRRAPKASLSDIVCDLIALEEEGGGLEYDLAAKTVSLTTDVIVLEGIYLGEFQIVLNWSNLVHGHPYNYSVIALDPHPAASNEGVTHPHVQDEGVCEGEGRQAIRASLAQGRVYDFFSVVANLLQTYNSESPYVALSEWDGIPCSDCGSLQASEDYWSCEQCGTSLCCECYVRCSDCDLCFCASCIDHCGGCDEPRCERCLQACEVCHENRCESCLQPQERCRNCHEQPTEQPAVTSPSASDARRDAHVVV